LFAVGFCTGMAGAHTHISGLPQFLRFDPALRSAPKTGSRSSPAGETVIFRPSAFRNEPAIFET
jgi:hypothetical protein